MAKTIDIYIDASIVAFSIARYMQVAHHIGTVKVDR